MARDKWRDYVLYVTEGDSQKEIQRKSGIDQGTISRWLNPEATRGAAVTSEMARRLATGYRLPIIEVLLHAGVLSEEEAGMKANPPVPLADIPYEEIVGDLRRLILELSRRIADGTPEGPPGEPS